MICGRISTRRILALSWVLAAVTLAAPAHGAQPIQTEAAPDAKADPWIAAHLPELVGLYMDLHTHPELSRKEVETSRRIAAELAKAGADVTAPVGKLGVVGVLKNGERPVVLVRTDMDALPIVEATGLTYASTVKTQDNAGREVGVMHACGHDVHMTSFIGTARWLADHRDRWSGTVVLVGQPAEEAVDGARGMLDDGLYPRFPKPDFALALHCRPDEPVGRVTVCSGPAMASSTSVTLTIRGRGGHGAWPHRTVDPIVLAALVVVDLQTIVSREIDPSEPAVVTVGSIHGGTKHNIIPDEVKLQLTLRAFSEPVRQQLVAGDQAPGDGTGPGPSSPRADGGNRRKHAPDDQHAGFGRAASCPRWWRRSAPRTSRPPSPSWEPKTFRSIAKATCRSACCGWARSAQSGSTQQNPRARPCRLCTRRSIIPEPGPSIATGIRAMTAAVVRLLPPKQ